MAGAVTQNKTFVVPCRMKVPNIAHTIHVDAMVCFDHFNKKKKKKKLAFLT